MATQKKPLSNESQAANSANHTISAGELLAEYRQRQRSARPLPASIAKAYEVLIARQEPKKDVANGR
jgi:hypothetical protein